MRYFIVAGLSLVAAGYVGNSALQVSQQEWVSNEVTGAIATDGASKTVSETKYNITAEDTGSSDVDTGNIRKHTGHGKVDVKSLFAPDVGMTEKLLLDQDWYMTVDRSGTMRGIYTVPHGTGLPKAVLRSLSEGHGIVRVDLESSALKVFPSKQELASKLTTFTEGAQKSVCAQSARPETLSASIDLKPGWSSTGQITFNATWKVSELCPFIAASRTVPKG